MTKREWTIATAAAAGAGLIVCIAVVVFLKLVLGEYGQPDIQLRDIRHLDPDNHALAISALTLAATQKSARIAELALFISAIGMVGLAMTISANLYAMYQTRRIFEEQANHTHDELRAYVSVSCRIVNFATGERPKVEIEIKNAGATPAFNARVSLALAYQFAGDDEALDYSIGEPFNPIFIQPGSISSARVTHQTPLTREHINEVSNMAKNEGHVMTAVGRVDYETYTGQPKATWFAVYFYGKGCEHKGNMPKYNGAT